LVIIATADGHGYAVKSLCSGMSCSCIADQMLGKRGIRWRRRISSCQSTVSCDIVQRCWSSRVVLAVFFGNNFNKFGYIFIILA